MGSSYFYGFNRQYFSRHIKKYLIDLLSTIMPLISEKMFNQLDVKELEIKPNSVFIWYELAKLNKNYIRNMNS